jgi:dipeptidyl-peptidase-4
MKQLAQRHSFIDIDRAGIYGHSWGGYRAARALLQFPDFFKVGVATAGSHDNFLFVSGHNRWYGRPQEYPDSYNNQSNMELAGNLKGKLLLAHGEIDDDVHIGLTLQLADALIKQNKDFDLFIHPTRDHKNLWQDGYMIRKSWDYFVQHLLHATPPIGVKVPDYDGPAYQRAMSVED